MPALNNNITLKLMALYNYSHYAEQNIEIEYSILLLTLL